MYMQHNVYETLLTLKSGKKKRQIFVCAEEYEITKYAKMRGYDIQFIQILKINGEDYEDDV